jgi:hypothetical protein
MNDEHEHELEQDALRRLRAADPAAAVEPRAGFADDVVAQATAETTAEPALTAESVPVADLTAERARRLPRWIPVAAVAASLVVVGAVGYGVGATTGGATNLADGAAPPISLQSESGAGATEQDLGTSDAAVPERTKMSQGGAADLMYPYGFGRNQFSASGLSTSEGTAAAYGFDARAASSAENVAALAASLGITAAPALTDGAWSAGPQDGTAPALWVSLDGMLSFSYSDPRITPWKCADGAETCEPTGDIPSEEAAIEALRSLLASAGRDPEAFEFTSETYEGAVTRSAQAWAVVDGQRLDQAWGVDLAGDGMVSAYGALADLVAIGDYPIVSEQEAFERLSDPRFGASMTNLPIALREQQVAEQPADAPSEWVPPTEPPAAPTAGAPLSWPVHDVEIVDARLGLASQWQPEGSVLVVPAYEFTAADGGTWSVIAVADAKLDFAAE